VKKSESGDTLKAMKKDLIDYTGEDETVRMVKRLAILEKQVERKKKKITDQKRIMKQQQATITKLLGDVENKEKIITKMLAEQKKGPHAAEMRKAMSERTPTSHHLSGDLVTNIKSLSLHRSKTVVEKTKSSSSLPTMTKKEHAELVKKEFVTTEEQYVALLETLIQVCTRILNQGGVPYPFMNNFRHTSSHSEKWRPQTNRKR